MLFFMICKFSQGDSHTETSQVPRRFFINFGFQETTDCNSEGKMQQDYAKQNGDIMVSKFQRKNKSI